MDRPPQTWEGGSNTFKIGSLKRRLPAVVLGIFRSDETSNIGTVSQQIILKNLNGSLKIQIMAAWASIDGDTPVTPDDIPAGIATMQLTPVVLTPNAGKIFGRPVFQDPTASPNSNTPLPQDLPFGWEFSTEADEVYIDIEMDTDAFNGTQLNGQLVVAATVEYNGSWWSIDAIKFAISQVQLTGCQAAIIGTGDS